MSCNISVVSFKVVIVHNNHISIDLIKDFLDPNITIIERSDIKTLPYILRANNVKCVIILLGSLPSTDLQFIKYVKHRFTLPPWIVVLDFTDFELIRILGYWNIERVLPVDEIASINEVLEQVTPKSIKVHLYEINIDKNHSKFSFLLKDLLTILEENYIHLIKISTLAEILQISESTIAREFQRFNLMGPKQILMSLKVNHAVKLMDNSGLNLGEIAHLSGFTNTKRMSECFNRVFNTSPGRYKMELLYAKEET